MLAEVQSNHVGTSAKPGTSTKASKKRGLPCPIQSPSVARHCREQPSQGCVRYREQQRCARELQEPEGPGSYNLEAKAGAEPAEHRCPDREGKMDHVVETCNETPCFISPLVSTVACEHT